MIIDLHTHTRPPSDDSFLEPSELIQHSKQAGLDAICFTEHDWFWNKDTLAGLVREHGFLVLPGVELNTDEGHYLVFGLEEYSFGMHHTEYLRQAVDEVGGVMILAHPYRRQYHQGDDIADAVEQYCRSPFFRLVDTIEVLNGRSTETQNEFSRELCRRLDLKGIGGSDAHQLSDIPTCATYFERRISNVEELITELKADRFRAVDLRNRP